MRTVPAALSILMHLGILTALALGRPVPLIDPTAPVMRISLTMGEPGGDERTSPVSDRVRPSRPATGADAATVAMPRVPTVPQPGPVPGKPRPPRQKTAPTSPDILKAALATAERGVETGTLDAALDEAKDMEHDATAGGEDGNDEGDEGGLYDLYRGRVILAVRPRWNMPTFTREPLTADVRVIVDGSGIVLDAKVEHGSGRPDFDASAINAILRTHKLPAPPTPAQQDMIIRFNSLELEDRRIIP